MFPLCCALCFSQKTTTVLCPPCLADIHRLRQEVSCPQCAAPGSRGWCARCLSKPPHYEYVIAPYIYRPPLDFLIRQFKYRRQWHLSRFLSRLLPPPPPIDALIPIPLFHKREQWRGFNQALELAKYLNYRVLNNGLIRVVDTSPQVEMKDYAARAKNVNGAFKTDANVYGLTVLLLDDVMTSGATMNEAAQTLRTAGAEKVIGMTIARPPT